MSRAQQDNYIHNQLWRSSMASKRPLVSRVITVFFKPTKKHRPSEQPVGISHPEQDDCHSDFDSSSDSQLSETESIRYILLFGVASVPVPGLNILLLEYRYQ